MVFLKNITNLMFNLNGHSIDYVLYNYEEKKDLEMININHLIPLKYFPGLLNKCKLPYSHYNGPQQ